VSVSNECDVFTGGAQTYKPGHDFNGSIYVPASEERVSGAMIALDPFTGQRQWEFKYVNSPNAGALATAGGLVFTGDSSGNFIALDAVSGKDAWHAQLGAAIYGSAVTFDVGGEQYVVIPSGSTLFAFSLPHP
jgi:outer membrane protein assembly factor BamB